MDAYTARVLSDQMRRTGRSLLQYTADATPWTDDSDRATPERLQVLVREETAALGALERFLRRNRVAPPYLGSYPEQFTSLNFLALDRLLPLLVEDQQRAVADLELALGKVSDPEALGQLQSLLQLKRRHLEALTELNKTHTPNSVRV